MRASQLCAALAAAAGVSAAGAQDVPPGPVRAEGAPSVAWERERAREAAGDFQGAIAACQQILHDHPKQQAQALTAIAGLYGKQRRYRDEIAWAKRALAVDPGFFAAEVNIGNAQAQLGQLKQAQAAFERARAMAPREPMPVYSLGVLAENRHDVPAAIALYEQSVALAPAFDSGWFNLAAMYARARRWDDALAALDKVLALDPHAEDARAMRRRVEADRTAASR
jgi:tetratricopeptide (TPR) repeat protein